MDKNYKNIQINKNLFINQYQKGYNKKNLNIKIVINKKAK